MRELSIGTKRYTKVVAVDYPGVGGACHNYQILKADNNDDPSEPLQSLAAINFQNGPIKETGINGVHNEDLIAIVIDRLEHFQAGEYAHRENEKAILHLRYALNVLRMRTTEREQRGVEGTSDK